MQQKTILDCRVELSSQYENDSLRGLLIEDVMMLVTFTCPAYADITMFGDAALQLLAMMGRSDAVPGALLPEDTQVALERLEAAVAAQPSPPEAEVSEDWDDDEPAIGLSRRALPLIELLQAAVTAKCTVMWDSSGTDH